MMKPYLIEADIDPLILRTAGARSNRKSNKLDEWLDESQF
jgi:hypothetical protein